MRKRIEGAPRRWAVQAGFLLGAAAVVLLAPAGLYGQSERDGPAPARPADERGVSDLAKIKEEEALQALRRLEEAMDRLAARLARTEPENAAKLREAFRRAREGVVREKMARILRYLEERKLDRALDTQEEVKLDLEEILAILLEDETDPRELLEHIRRLREILKDLDTVYREETGEKLASDEAAQAEADSKALEEDLRKLEDLIREEKEIEKAAGDPRNAGEKERSGLRGRQEKVRRATEALRRGDEEREARRRKAAEEEARRRAEDDGHGHGDEGGGESAAEAGKEQGGAGKGEAGGEGSKGGGASGKGAASEGSSGKSGGSGESPSKEGASGSRGAKSEEQASPEEAGSVLDRKKLREAEEAMRRAEEAFAKGDMKRAREEAGAARRALEEANAAGRERLERLRRKRDFARMKDEQDATRRKTDEIAEKLRKPVPLVSDPEGGVPGRKDVEAASQEMSGASGELGQGRPRPASQKQRRALDRLAEGREKVEEALDTLQRAFRERLLAYLRSKFSEMLKEQRAVTASTRSLDLKLHARLGPHFSPAEVDRKDARLAESLSRREGALARSAETILDVLTEDGTTLVFPELVEELKADLENASGLLSRLETGAYTQSIQKDIEATIEEILRALEEALKRPPPPNPNQGRNSKGGGGSPLLPPSSELKMVRALQLRVNRRTETFDEERAGRDLLAPEEKLQLEELARKEKEVERILRKIAQALGETSRRR